MHPLLEEWDATYLLSVTVPGEGAGLEKKASAKFDLSTTAKKKDTREEIAKQVSAFANSGDGFLIFGVLDSGGLDAGVSSMVGSQPVKAWVEAEIPKLTTPAVHRCEARLIQVPGPMRPTMGHWSSQSH